MGWRTGRRVGGGGEGFERTLRRHEWSRKRSRVFENGRRVLKTKGGRAKGRMVEEEGGEEV